jgi:hypothetical protein
MSDDRPTYAELVRAASEARPVITSSGALYWSVRDILFYRPTAAHPPADAP